MIKSLRRLLWGKAAGHARRWARILMSEPCRITVGRGEVRPAILNQLSAGGARIATAQRLRAGDMIRLEFTIGVGEHYSVTALVVYTSKDERGFQWYGGLCFVNVPPRGDERIADFIEEEQRRRQIGFAMPRT